MRIVGHCASARTRTSVHPGAAPGTLRSLMSFAALAALLFISIAGSCGAAAAGPDAPDFAGTARPITPASQCPAVLPEGMAAPFGPNAGAFTVADYQIHGCWEGALAGRPFVLDLYGSRLGGGGMAARYGGRLVAHALVGSGPPAVIRFTGADVCWVENAGARYGAVDLETGLVLPDGDARSICPPQSYPPAYVLGLGSVRYSFAALFPSATASSEMASASASPQIPLGLPNAGGRGEADVP